MKKIILPGLLVGIAMLAVGFLFNFGFNELFPELAEMYENGAMFRPWEDPLMMLFFLHPFILGLAFAWVWNKTKTLFHAPCIGRRAFKFATVMFFLNILPGMWITFSSFQISLLLVGSWTISSCIQYFAAGLVLVKTNE